MVMHMKNFGHTRYFRLSTLGLLAISLLIISSIAFLEDDNDAYPGVEYGEENGFQYAIYAEEVSISKMDDTLLENPVIPTTIKGYPVTEIDFIRNVSGTLTIPDSVKEIGQEAFDGCSGLTGVLKIPDSVEYLGAWAFRNCSGFTGELIIPGSVKEIGSEAFQGCSGFSTLTIEDGVETIGFGSFKGCIGLTGNLVIPDSVVSIYDRAFSDLQFDGLLKLSKSVTTIGDYAFMGCSGLTGNLIIPDSVVWICKYAFSGCSGFSGDLIIPNGVHKIEDRAFSDCSGFTGKLIIPKSVVEVGSNAFVGCININFLCFESKKVPSRMNSECFGLGVPGRNVYCTILGLEKGELNYYYTNNYTITTYGNGSEHTVRYDVDGGSEEEIPHNVASGETFRIALYSGTKEGYVFVGWSYNGKVYDHGDTTIMGDSDITFKAVWEPVGSSTNPPDDNSSTSSILLYVIGLVVCVSIILTIAIFYVNKNKN